MNLKMRSVVVAAVLVTVVNADVAAAPGTAEGAVAAPGTAGAGMIELEIPVAG